LRDGAALIRLYFCFDDDTPYPTNGADLQACSLMRPPNGKRPHQPIELQFRRLPAVRDGENGFWRDQRQP
jgi:hypothetical protein